VSASNPGREATAGATSASRPWLAFAGCCAIWGSTFLFISIGNDELAPVWAAALRLACASIILFALSRWTGQKLPSGPGLWPAIGYGALQFGLNFPLLYWGEKTVPSGIAAVLFATIPLSSAIFARLFGIERLQPLKLLGALIAIGGVAVIGGPSGNPTEWMGVFAVLAAVVAASLGTTLLKMGPRPAPFATNALGSLVGLPICLAISRALGESWTIPHSTSAWISIGYLTLAGSVGAFVLMTWLLHHWPVTRVAFISVVTPIVAMLLGALVRHEPLTLASLGGSALVLAGLGCALAGDRLPTRSSGH